MRLPIWRGPTDIALRISARSQAERHDENADESQDLDEREPKLEFAKESDAEKVDGENGKIEDDEPYCDVDRSAAAPVLAA